jgi:hypothetical protein
LSAGTVAIPVIIWPSVPTVVTFMPDFIISSIIKDKNLG